MNRLRELFGVDLRSLALFRICVGLIVLFDVASRLPDVAAFYADTGVLPRLSLLSRISNPWVMSLHLMSGTALVQAALLILQGVCGAGLVAGWRTRWMAALAWFLTASLHRRNHMVAGGGDDYFRLLLFWSMFLPMGARWSLDRAPSPARQPLPTQAFSVGTAAILLQTAMGYLMAVYHKWNLPAWREGTAIYYALSIDNYAKEFASVLLGFPSLLQGLTYATLWFEWLGPFLLFCPVFMGPIRTVTVLGFLLMHGGFSLSMHLMLFPVVSAAAMLVFLPSWFWDRLVFRQRGLPGPRVAIRSSKSANACAIVLLICVISWNLEAVKPLHYRMPEALRALTHLAHLDQAWRMFAPPPPTSGWFVIPGTLKDGTEVDLFRQGTPVSWDKPPPRDRFRNERWRRYMFSFVFGKNKVFWPDYARYLCRSWNAGHAGLQQLESLEIVFMARETPPPGQTGIYEKHVLLKQGCADVLDGRPAPGKVGLEERRWVTVSSQEGEMRPQAILGAGLVAMGIAAGRPDLSTAATTKELQDQARAHLAKREVDRAKPILDIILNTAKEPGAIRDAARNLAIIARLRNELDAFVTQADSELSQNPASQAARWKVIEGYAISERPDAIERLRTLLDQTPKSEMLRVRLAQTYLKHGQGEQALALLEEGLKAAPASQAYHDAIAKIKGAAAKPAR